jgi:hypothetical protein
MTSPGNLGSRIGAPIRRIRPEFDMDVWRAKRAVSVVREKRQLDHLAKQIHARQGDVHLVVAPHFGPDAPTWHVAGQNHFFEVYQSAIEILGAERVTLFGVTRDEPAQDWHRRLLETMHKTQATHLIAQIENDPNQAHSWTWDVIGSLLAKQWNGALIGVMYDSAFPWLRMKARRLGRIMPQLLVAELCEPMSGQIRSGRIEVGPMTMPLSKATVDAIDAHIAGAPKIHQLTFIGALYDYRVDLIAELRRSGVDVSVNPHRPDVTTNFDESRTNQPSYLDYMMGLAQSDMTLNFSLASGGPVEQYKIRVQEAGLAGCLCLTDDRDRTRHFFAANEYAYFPSLDAIPRIVAERLADPVQLRADQQAARVRAHELARTDFWGRIEQGLIQRGLPALTGISPPNEPV